MANPLDFAEQKLRYATVLGEQLYWRTGGAGGRLEPSWGLGLLR